MSIASAYMVSKDGQEDRSSYHQAETILRNMHNIDTANNVVDPDPAMAELER
mgnify:CR=1 FL=1